MQDPLSSVPHESFQDYRARRLAHASLPQNPTLATNADASSVSTAAATVSAGPQLRDLKKEATAFIPTALRKKRAGTVSGPAPKVNAAPSIGPDTGNSEPMAGLERPDLLGMLKHQFGPSSGTSGSTKADSKAGSKPKDDYQKFVEEMGDLL